MLIIINRKHSWAEMNLKSIWFLFRELWLFIISAEQIHVVYLVPIKTKYLHHPPNTVRKFLPLTAISTDKTGDNIYIYIF